MNEYKIKEGSKPHDRTHSHSILEWALNLIQLLQSKTPIRGTCVLSPSSLYNL